MTRSLPATMASPPSSASMLATRMNLSTSLACAASRSTKHFWLLRMVARITSSRNVAGNSRSNEPISTTGHSTRPATSASRPSSSTSSSPCAKASCFASVRMMSRRRSASSTTLALSSFCMIIGEAAHGERLRRQEAMAARLVARRDAVDRKRHDVRLLGLRPERRHDGMQRPHPSQRAGLLRAARPSAWISARESP